MRHVDKPSPADLGLDAGEGRLLRSLATPEQVQAFVTSLPANHEEGGATLYSVRRVLRHGKGHCIEGAFVAACALWLQGRPPLVVDMTAQGDADHVITVFRRDGCWGAISKTNHAWLRWRDPVYRSLRELIMSYFHEYARKEHKSLRAYSRAIDMRRFPGARWITNEDDCWEVGAAIDDARHYPVITAAQARRLRPREAFEVKIDGMVEYPPAKARQAA
jgi:hypothetical protein